MDAVATLGPILVGLTLGIRREPAGRCVGLGAAGAAQQGHLLWCETSEHHGSDVLAAPGWIQVHGPRRTSREYQAGP